MSARKKKPTTFQPNRDMMPCMSSVQDQVPHQFTRRATWCVGSVSDSGTGGVQMVWPPHLVGRAQKKPLLPMFPDVGAELGARPDVVEELGVLLRVRTAQAGRG